MKIGNVLRESRIKSKMTVEQVSNILIKQGYKASQKTVYSWENGNSRPDIEILMKLCDIYGIKDILRTFGYDGYKEDGSLQLNMKEVGLVEKYRFISVHSPDGANVVDTVLDREYSIAEKLEQAPATIVELHNGSNEKGRLIDYYRSVSAGSGEVIFDDVYSERITLPDIPEYRRVAYAVKVDGRSMEPLYNDGDILLIEPTCEVEINEIGIFNVNGQAYVKKLGKDKLISLNKGYDDITLTEDSLCMGRVVGKL